jgi:hypothetical protein
MLHSRKFLGTIGLFVGLILFGIFVYRYISLSGEGTIIDRSNDGASQQQKELETTLRLEGEHFSLAYGSFYSDVKNLGPSASEIERHRLVNPDSKEGRTAAIAVKQAPSGGVSDDTAYNFRKNRPDEYQELIISPTVTIMKKSDNSEVTTFISNRTYLGIIALTTSRPSESLTEEARQFAQNWNWR